MGEVVSKKHLLLSVPDGWSNDEKGDFYESFIAELLLPMRLRVAQRIRVTGMEIDLLAEGEDQPRTVLVECKAHRDPLPADVISKLLGNVTLRKADAGWLFSTSDLSKDGKGLWEEIRHDKSLARTFTWFSPEKTIEVLQGQRSIVDPATVLYLLSAFTVGDWTLVVSPTHRCWLVQLIEQGIPTRYCVFDANTGKPLALQFAKEIANLSPRYSSLVPLEISNDQPARPLPKTGKAVVARVISGDTWDDLRPSRPADFVGRDDLIADVMKYIDQALKGETSTRTFAIQGPSGWGKSSLILKLSDLVTKRRILRCSLTAVDTRSATNTAFVSEAIRLAFLDAAKCGMLPKSEFRVESLRDPLDSRDLMEGLESLHRSQSLIVLIFDQFEELFSKEELFETFTAIRELSLDMDARQVPMILGFAWKTDVSLPQLHPAYHLWHELGDRRRAFKIRKFDGRDTQKIISKAEMTSGNRLSSALRARIVEQCQGLPWLLKKLLVHVLQRVSTLESQYVLLERELDVELLFKEDLSVLNEEQIRCLKYVAVHGPVAVSEVEENFSRDSTNLLINSHLLVRSGMNYVVYWDIFRDYLVEERVPQIPWARTFQRGPMMAIRALNKLSELAPVAVSTLAPAIGLKEGPCFNLVGDLVALQLVDSAGNGMYSPASHLLDLKPGTIAKHVQGQLRRHVVVRELTATWEREELIDPDAWYEFFAEADPRMSSFSDNTVHQYANNLRGWLLFAGILETRNKWLTRPLGVGQQAGVLGTRKMMPGVFLGAAAPNTLVRLFRLLKDCGAPVKRSQLDAEGFRNATTDGIVLGALTTSRDGNVRLSNPQSTLEEIVQAVKKAVLSQNTIQIVAAAQRQPSHDITTIEQRLEEEVGATWKPASARRYANGLRRYLEWATSTYYQPQLD